MLIEATTPFGKVIEYSPAPSSYHDYVRTYVPSELSSKEFCRTFKKDLTLDLIVEKTTDTDVYFVEYEDTTHDELYYFNCSDKLFHGDKIWSQYHPFISAFRQIAPSCVIEQPCWFAGTRNNYTHQLLDFLPNLLLREELNASVDISSRVNIYGKSNKILESLKESSIINNAWSRKSISLANHGTAHNFGNVKIRCIKFRDLAIPKHISIFKAYDLLKNAFGFVNKSGKQDHSQSATKIGFLRRQDGRIENQADIETHLLLSHGARVIHSMAKLSYAEKFALLGCFKTLILPPGSDNINAFCFAPTDTKLIQLIPFPIQDFLSSPFYSYAGIRYALPFLSRITFVSSVAKAAPGSINGTWSTRDIDEAIFRASTG